MTDREKLIELLGKGCDYAHDKCSEVGCDECEGGDHNGCTLVYLADHLIANGVVVREKGEWELRHVGHGHYWECSVCHKNPCIYVTKDTQFCPNCGADMRKGENG